MSRRLPWILLPGLFACSAFADEGTGGTEKAEPPAEGLAVATFAGGCFWCMEPPFEKAEGVVSAVSGYTGGEEVSPAYKRVAYGRTGHRESVRVTYDPQEIGYEELLRIFWRNIDPTDGGGQFVDRGAQYAPAIFVHDPEQRAVAEKSKKALAASERFGGEEIVVPILEAGGFWVAETYHQDFHKKSSAHYERYRRGSGRDAFLAEHWPDKAEDL
jgi:peptide methionine sulfoxide reductase msrA/msrB